MAQAGQVVEAIVSDSKLAPIFLQPFLVGIEKRIVYGNYLVICEKSPLFDISDDDDNDNSWVSGLSPTKYAEAITTKNLPLLLGLEKTDDPSFTYFWHQLNNWDPPNISLSLSEMINVWKFINYFQLSLTKTSWLSGWMNSILLFPPEKYRLSPEFRSILSSITLGYPSQPLFESVENKNRMYKLLTQHQMVITASLFAKRVEGDNYFVIVYSKEISDKKFNILKENLSNTITNDHKMIDEKMAIGSSRLNFYSTSIPLLLDAVIQNGMGKILDETSTTSVFDDICKSSKLSKHTIRLMIIEARVRALEYCTVKECDGIGLDKTVIDFYLKSDKSSLSNDLSLNIKNCITRAAVNNNINNNNNSVVKNTFVFIDEKEGIYIEDYSGIAPTFLTSKPEYNESIEKDQIEYYHCCGLVSVGILDLLIVVAFSEIGPIELVDVDDTDTDTLEPVVSLSNNASVTIDPSILERIKFYKDAGIYTPYQILSMLSLHLQHSCHLQCQR